MEPDKILLDPGTDFTEFSTTSDGDNEEDCFEDVRLTVEDILYKMNPNDPEVLEKKFIPRGVYSLNLKTNGFGLLSWLNVALGINMDMVAKCVESARQMNYSIWLAEEKKKETGIGVMKKDLEKLTSSTTTLSEHDQMKVKTLMKDIMHLESPIDKKYAKKLKWSWDELLPLKGGLTWEMLQQQARENKIKYKRAQVRGNHVVKWESFASLMNKEDPLQTGIPVSMGDKAYKYFAKCCNAYGEGSLVPELQFIMAALTFGTIAAGLLIDDSRSEPTKRRILADAYLELYEKISKANIYRTELNTTFEAMRNYLEEYATSTRGLDDGCLPSDISPARPDYVATLKQIKARMDAMEQQMLKMEKEAEAKRNNPLSLLCCLSPKSN